MRGRKKAAICTAAVMGISLTLGGTVLAREDSIALPYQQESAWEEIALTNDDTVSTGVNVRGAADEDSQVIGCLYQGGAAWVLDRGEEWTEIYSGGLTGFVKNEYLVYGEDAKELAQGHGVEGVSTTWSDVKLYSGADGGSEVLDSLACGDSFILTQDEGHWLQVQNGADSTAYISSEDVSRVLLLDTAVPTDEAYVEEETTDGSDTEESYTDESYTDASYTDESYTEDSYTEDSYIDESYTEDSYIDESYTDTSYTDESYADTSYTEESYADTSYTEESYTDTSYTDESYTDTSYTEESYTDTSYTDESYTDTGSSDTTTGGESYYDAETGIYYDASTGLYYDSGTGILYDAWWNPVNEDIATPMTTAASGTSDDGSGADAGNYGENSSDGFTDETAGDGSGDASGDASQAVSTDTDDTSLLAALIYCEAGNQSYEGMVAVGAVVMNRVNSPSFPNTISGVIYQSGQFTPASSGGLASALANGVPSTCYDAAVAAIGGENPIGSALYFNTGSGKGTKLGDHQFY